MKPGDSVKILPTFDEAFPDTYTIRELKDTTAFLDGLPEGYADAFDVIHLVLE
jgi:hypothetical protein